MDRLILSRKGFDSAAGGGPSPILTDGRMVSLPIPEPRPSNISTRYTDLMFGEATYDDLLDRLGYSKHRGAAAHLDPDVVLETRTRTKDWRACLGQVDQAEAHLQGQGVGAGALFLFWGWFEHIDDNFRFQSKKGFHAIFAYMEVDFVVEAGVGDVVGFADYHPHFSDPYRGKTNRVYVARSTLSWNPNQPGWGVFRYDPRLRLSRPGETRSNWQLPGCFHPSKGCNLSYLPAGTRWGDPGEVVDVQSPGRGQEFVCKPSEDISAWARSIIDETDIWSPGQHGEDSPTSMDESKAAVTRVTEEPPTIEKIVEVVIQNFDDDKKLHRSEAYSDGGTHMLLPRLNRAATNQALDGEAALSRYAIWANTARDHIAEALRLLDEDRPEAERLLRLAHNSLSAFAEIQAIFDPMNSGKK